MLGASRGGPGYCKHLSWQSMPTKQRKVSFKGLSSASAASSRAARGSSIKQNTRCEMKLRRELFSRGFRYRLHYAGLPGLPDVIFPKQKLVIFCDGDFWHGRELKERLEKLTQGHNANYWTAKISRNHERDLTNTKTLEAEGWTVLRFWESDILNSAGEVADRIERTLFERRSHRATPPKCSHPWSPAKR